MRPDVLRLTLATLVTLHCAVPSMCQAPPVKSQTNPLSEIDELRAVIEELKEENETLRNLLPTSTSNSKTAIASLTKEVAAMRERLQALEQERATSGREFDRLRAERDRLRADIARLYSDYFALSNALLAMRAKLTILPVEIDVHQLRAQLSAALDSIDLKTHITINGDPSLQRGPTISPPESPPVEEKKVTTEAGKLLPEDYSFRVLNPDQKKWAELFSSKVIAIEIVKGKESGKDWTNVKLWGEHTPTLPPVDGLEIKHKDSGNNWHHEWSIFPKKTGTYVLNFGIAGSTNKALKQSLEVKSGGWRLPLRFLWWLVTNYLFWLGGTLMVIIGHADKILSFLKNWREARRASYYSTYTAQQIGS
jgi:hypothetical protein